MTTIPQVDAAQTWSTASLAVRQQELCSCEFLYTLYALYLRRLAGDGGNKRQQLRESATRIRVEIVRATRIVRTILCKRADAFLLMGSLPALSISVRKAVCSSSSSPPLLLVSVRRATAHLAPLRLFVKVYKRRL